MHISGYFYTTIEEANAAIAIINTGEGIPVSPNATTKTYCNPLVCVVGWYVPFSEVTERYLGEPTQIELENTDLTK
jgi:hypothetical protein